MDNIVDTLKAQGVCPTCYNFKHGGVYGDFSDRMLYENDILYCFLEERPRSAGHTIILVKEHFNDMHELPDSICADVYVLAKKAMNAIKDVCGAERVYLCTMCDGAVNHFHLQLIPRYKDSKIGSTNFVKPREEYVHDENITTKLKAILAG